MSSSMGGVKELGVKSQDTDLFTFLPVEDFGNRDFPLNDGDLNGEKSKAFLFFSLFSFIRFMITSIAGVGLSNDSCC